MRALVSVVVVGVASCLVAHAAPGDPVGPEIQVNTYTTGSQAVFYQAVSSDGAGGFVVVWRSPYGDGTDTSGLSIHGRRLDAAGLPVGAEFQVNTYTTDHQGAAAVAPMGAGGFVVVWASNQGDGPDASGSIQAQRYDATGMPLGGQFEVNLYTPSFQDSPAVTPLGTAGAFVVVWRSDGSGETDTSGTSIQARLFDVEGMPLGEFQVNSYTTGTQRTPAVLALEDGGFVVVWSSLGSGGSDTDDESVQMRRFDGAGTPAGPDFQVNTYTTSYQAVPGIGADGSGGFVVTWASGGSAGSDSIGASAQARRFDAAGNALGDDFQVNAYTTGAQYGYAVAPDAAGGFVLVWVSTSDPVDTSDRSIHLQHFDPTGAPAGGDFLVNTYTTGSQDLPIVAPDGAGGFLVAWESVGSAGTDASGVSVQARRFEGAATTTSTSVTTTTTLAPNGELLAGRKLELAAKPGHAAKSKLTVLARGLTLGAGNGSADDPVVHGGAFTISSGPGGFAATQALVGAWKYVGKVGQDKGYKWKSRTSPVRSVAIKAGRLTIAGRGAGLGFDLDDDPDPVDVTLAIGAHAYCLEFGGAAPRFKPNRLYRAKGAPAPASCP
jgi:hypothetical protein